MKFQKSPSVIVKPKKKKERERERDLLRHVRHSDALTL